ncbi:MAG TPA: hypothetical protein VFU65_00665 [Actinocrinis sp.]|nr:hypothetical protein [Actinocrinis sp.]
MFVVDNNLLTQIVLPFGRRLLDQGRDALYAWINQRRQEGRAPLPEAQQARCAELNDLGRFAENHPGTAGRLASAVIIEVGAADNLIDADQRDEGFLQAFLD